MNRIQINVKLVFVMTRVMTWMGVNLVSAAGPKGIRKYPIPDQGILELIVPTSWKDNIHKPQKDMPLTIIFVPAKGNDFKISITVLRNKPGEQDFNSPIERKYFDKIPSNSPLPKGRTYYDPPLPKGRTYYDPPLEKGE